MHWETEEEFRLETRLITKDRPTSHLLILPYGIHINNLSMFILYYYNVYIAHNLHSQIRTHAGINYGIRKYTSKKCATDT